VRARMLLDWGGVQADACVQEHPVTGAAVPRPAGSGAEGRGGAGLNSSAPPGATCRRGVPRNSACETV
jgi:hypothetical protein